TNFIWQIPNTIPNTFFSRRIDNAVHLADEIIVAKLKVFNNKKMIPKKQATVRGSRRLPSTPRGRCRARGTPLLSRSSNSITLATSQEEDVAGPSGEEVVPNEEVVSSFRLPSTPRGRARGRPRLSRSSPNSITLDTSPEEDVAGPSLEENIASEEDDCDEESVDVEASLQQREPEPPPGSTPIP
ncbi:Uncharacterized protein APZ42_006110, partial [Daphnia magna]